jgi:hypothetical protein
MHASSLHPSSTSDSNPIAFLIHTYRGALDEAFEVTKGPRLTPEEMRQDGVACPWNAVCVVRAIPGAW